MAGKARARWRQCVRRALDGVSGCGARSMAPKGIARARWRRWCGHTRGAACVGRPALATAGTRGRSCARGDVARRVECGARACVHGWRALAVAANKRSPSERSTALGARGCACAPRRSRCHARTACAAPAPRGPRALESPLRVASIRGDARWERARSRDRCAVCTASAWRRPASEVAPSTALSFPRSTSHRPPPAAPASRSWWCARSSGGPALAVAGRRLGWLHTRSHGAIVHARYRVVQRVAALAL